MAIFRQVWYPMVSFVVHRSIPYRNCPKNEQETIGYHISRNNVKKPRFFNYLMVLCGSENETPSIVGLVTFRRNKYMTVETFKTGSWTRNKRKWDTVVYSSNLGYIFNILSIWEKSVFSTIFVPVLRVFSRFTCKNGGFWVFSINIGHIHGRKKTTSTWHLILKILQWFSFDLKTPNPMLNRLQCM